jgi:hypothetical protein
MVAETGRPLISLRPDPPALLVYGKVILMEVDAAGEKNRLRASWHTDWAYAAFFTQYPLNHFDCAIVEKAVMNYANDGWAPRHPPPGVCP